MLLALSTIIVYAQVSKTVNMTTAGSLSTTLSSYDKTYLSNLTVTGNIDARDIKCMRDEIIKLEILDISAVTIKSYTGTGGTYAPVSTLYPANEMPQFSFCDNYTTYTSKTTLKTIVLPNSLTSIGMYSFYGCTGLTGLITIPSSVVSIGGAAFYNCRGLTGSLVIPNSVTSIETSSFTYCQGLTSIVIPSSVTSITFNAFSYCSGLTAVISYLKVPVVLAALTDVFIGINKSTCTLYVPIGSKSLYKSSYQWKDFLNIVEMTTAVPTIANEKIKIYPNPIKEGFRVNGLNGKTTIRLSDGNGKVFFEKLFVNDEYISMNSKPKGIYIVELTTDDETITRKIIKQ